MSVLVTGATGFVGSAVARKLAERGERLRVLVRKSSDRRNLQGLEAEPVEGDLRDPASLARALKGCSALYHVAADYRLWTRRPGELYEANVEGSKNIVLAACDAGVGRIVYTSSVAVLGINKDTSPADEETPVTLDDMIGHYKRSKFLAEEAVAKLIAERDAPVIIVNPSTPIGPRDVKPTPTGRLVLEAAAGKMPAYVDTGLNVAHVDDVAQGHLLAFEKGEVGERYVLGGDDMSLKEILHEVARIAGRKPPRVRLPHNLVMPIAAVSQIWARLFGGEPMATIDGIRMARKKMYFSSAKAKAALGYSPRPGIEALADAVAWFREQGYLA
ncbi:MAG: hopanoid-associated sugar epimerase [Alphaproteobacteria bacterium]